MPYKPRASAATTDQIFKAAEKAGQVVMTKEDYAALLEQLHLHDHKVRAEQMRVSRRNIKIKKLEAEIRDLEDRLVDAERRN